MASLDTTTDTAGALAAPVPGTAPAPGTAPNPDTTRAALATLADVLGDLRMAACSLRAVASEDDPVDEETRLAVTGRVASLLRKRAEVLEDALDLLEDHCAESGSCAE